MRDAHRPKTLPNRKLPRGIERQDELIDLIEKRFHQEDLIRTALRKKDEETADERTDETNDIAAAEQAEATAEESTSAEKPAEADESLCTEADSATDHAGDATDTVTIRWHGQNETIADPRTWLTVFDTVREAGDVVTREVAKRRFHGESYWKTCDALYLSTGTYYHHVRAILHYAFACAVYHRLIDPRPKHHLPKAM